MRERSCEVRRGHAERLKDVRVGVAATGARRAFDREGSMAYPGIRVEVLVSRLGSSAPLTGEDTEDGLVVEASLVAPACENHQRVDVAQPLVWWMRCRMVIGLP